MWSAVDIQSTSEIIHEEVAIYVVSDPRFSTGLGTRDNYILAY